MILKKKSTNYFSHGPVKKTVKKQTGALLQEQHRGLFEKNDEF